MQKCDMYLEFGFGKRVHTAMVYGLPKSETESLCAHYSAAVNLHARLVRSDDPEFAGEAQSKETL